MKRLRALALFAMLILLSGAGATYLRYQSLDPCDWMEQDLTTHFDLPTVVVRAKIRAEFLLLGIVEPGPRDCLFEWWRLRREGTLTAS